MIVIADDQPVNLNVIRAQEALYTFATTLYQTDGSAKRKEPHEVIENLMLSLIDYHQHQRQQYIVFQANHGRHDVPGDLGKSMDDMLATARQYLKDEYPPQA